MTEKKELIPAEDLKKQGWEKQTIYDEPRLSEIVEMYHEIGLEVRLEPFNENDEPGCSECMKTAQAKFWTVYTRKKNEVTG